jgi:hypothetical protein
MTTGHGRKCLAPLPDSVDASFTFSSGRLEVIDYQKDNIRDFRPKSGVLSLRKTLTQVVR